MIENNAFQATKTAMITIGFTIGAILFGLIIQSTNLQAQPIEFGILAFSWLSLVFCMFFLALALRKFGSNEIHEASIIVKKANVLMATGFFLLFIYLSLVLAKIELVYGATFFVISLISLIAFFIFLKKNFKYS